MKVYVANYSGHKMTLLLDYLSAIEDVEVIGHYAPSSIEAIQDIRKHNPDVVIINSISIGMDIGAGMAVLRNVRASKEPAKVIMIADDDSHYKTRRIEEKNDHFFCKSEIDHIASMIKNCPK